jgi:cellulose synthase/poly-beta-1,6-N-acetylglucosamine synthase-like glycosyltransferase
MAPTEAAQMPALLIFLSALAVLCYAYFGYPAILALSAACRRTHAGAIRGYRPTVTVVVAAWNEAASIADKIENTLGQHYPPELLDMIVVSDGSTDGTDEIVERYVATTGRLRLLRTEGRQGKSLALNLGVPAATGEIAVLTDANAIFAPDAVSRLVEPLADARVGAVSGELKYRTAGGLDEGEGVYWRYEQWVKLLESRLHSLVGANGAIYAIRRELFRPLRAVEVDDLRIPYQALLEGYRVVLEPAAVCHEPSAPSLWAEYRRKVRIMSGAIPTILGLLMPTLLRGRVILCWQLVSHKLLREVQAIFFAGMLVGAGWGALLGDSLLSLLLGGQLVLYLAGALAWGFPKVASAWGGLRLAAHFDMIALASFAALGLWLTGRVRATWQPGRGQAE